MTAIVERVTGLGNVRGVVRLEVENYLGLRYAQPVKRFMPSEPATTWSGVYDATVRKAISPQGVPDGNHLGPQTATQMSEDCLFLNVHVPKTPSGTPRPVMVWVHGGGHVSGAANFYDGTALALGADAVVVCINYRLGILGSMDRTRDGTAEEGTGELWLDDQIAALRWVRDHVADYGGNPNLVTIIGESGGAVSVSALCAAPATRGLIHRAVACSPGRLVVDRARNTLDDVARIKRCSRAKALEFLVTATTDELIKFQQRQTFSLGRPEVAGTPHLPGAIDELIRNRGSHVVPLIAGYAPHEADSLDHGVKLGMRWFPWPLPNIVQHLVSRAIVSNPAGGTAKVPEYLRRLKKVTGVSSFGARLNDLIWTDTFRRGAMEYTEATTAAGSRGYLYVFDVPCRFLGRKMRSTHIVDLDFTFNIWADPEHTIRGISDHPKAPALAQRWVVMLGHFARTGEPGDALGPWPVYEPAQRQSLRVTADGCRVEHDIDAEFREQIWT